MYKANSLLKDRSSLGVEVQPGHLKSSRPERMSSGHVHGWPFAESAKRKTQFKDDLQRN